MLLGRDREGSNRSVVHFLDRDIITRMLTAVKPAARGLVARGCIPLEIFFSGLVFFKRARVPMKMAGRETERSSLMAERDGTLLAKGSLITEENILGFPSCPAVGDGG